MSVAVQYPFPGMHSPTTASSKPVLPPSYHSPATSTSSPPCKPSGGRPSTSSKFDSHDDFYDFLDSNRGSNGGPLNPNSNNMQQGGSPNMQRPVPINGPDQSRPPVTRGTGGAQMRSRPPSYGSGSRSEEMLVDKHREQRDRERRQQQQREAQLQQQQLQLQQQQNASPAGPAGAGKPVGGPRSPTSDSPSANATWRAGSGAHPQSSQQPQQSSQNARPTSSDSASSSEGRPMARTNTAAGAALGAAIQRLNKVTEYLGFMTQEEDDIARLDKEIATLQARKAEAEARHAEFKSKHDDYRRQYADVERALRGDAPPMPGMRHAATATTNNPVSSSNGPPTTRELQQQQAAAQAMGRPSVHNPQHDSRHMDDDDLDEDDYDDEDEYQARRPGSRRIMSQQSFGRALAAGQEEPVPIQPVRRRQMRLGHGGNE
ncbi:hypothetical protein PG993_013329 [Apiospora rasikravindrae]|uniref:Uncharacterized protein n=1 Tax=Apiospora rasikravindrae TaxID=990691 RepID=A0ABR1RXB7_9PEZI